MMSPTAPKRCTAGCVLLALGFFVLTGCCCAAKQPDSADSIALSTNTTAAATNGVTKPKEWYSVVVKPPADFRPIRFYEKLNPVWWLQNRDEPHPPAWFDPNGKHREFKWWVRNPSHNFTFYVIGITDKKCVRSGRYPEKVLVPGRWNIAASRYKFIYFPYVSFSSKHGFNFYFGWRRGGNFGIKLNHEKPREAKAKPDKAPDQKPADSLP